LTVIVQWDVSEYNPSSLQYVPIDQQIIDVLKKTDNTQLGESGVSATILSMIRQGIVPQLREDVLDDLSLALGLDL